MLPLLKEGAHKQTLSDIKDLLHTAKSLIMTSITAKLVCGHTSVQSTIAKD
jgi:hypothetical protein